jgi:hypothetical protein
MDSQRDADAFRKKLAGLCEVMGKPLTDELLETWWKALRHCDFAVVAGKMQAFANNANDTTRFPRPSQMRPADLPAPSPGEDQRNWIRDYWRSHVWDCYAWWFRRPAPELQRQLVEHKATLGQSLRELIDELEMQDRRDGRSTGQLKYAQQRVGHLARLYPHLRGENAPPLPDLDVSDQFV